MAADALAHCIFRPSAAMILIIWNVDDFVFLDSESQQAVPIKCWEMVESDN